MYSHAMTEPVWLNITAAARYLGIHRNTLWRRCQKGTGPAFYRVSTRGDHRFRPEDLDAWLAAQRTGE